MGSKKKNKKRRMESGESGGQTKTPRNGGSPVDMSGAVSDSIRKANSVLFDNSILDSSTESTENTENMDANSSVFDSTELAAAGSSGTNVSTPLVKQTPTNTDILDYLKRMDAKINNMDSRLKKLDSLEKKVGSFETEIKKLWNFVQDCSKKAEAKSNEICDKVENLEMSLGLSNDKLTQLNKDRERMQEELLYIQSQSMRQNLIFTNIEEGENETPVQTEASLRLFMVDKLKLAQTMVDQLQIERAHRMGVRRIAGSSPRNIVAKFAFYKDRETVRRQNRELDGTPFSVFEQFPREIVQRRKLLIPKLKQARRDKKNAWLSYDTLYVNGVPMRCEAGNQN